MEYAIHAGLTLTALIAGYFLGKYRERNRQAKLRNQSFALRHFGPPNHSKD